MHRTSTEQLYGARGSPTSAQQRRLIPPSPNSSQPKRRERSPSPLRNVGASPGSADGDLPGGASDDDGWGNARRYTYQHEEPTSPLGTAFARVANSVMSSLASRPQGLPSDAELEAEAIRERERSRREAERILTQEAEERRVMEEKILAMRNYNSSQTSLPPPHAPSYTSTSPTTGSPRAKDKDESWWQAAKSRLTPTKELTAAQQIIQDTKSKDKDAKKKGKDKDRPEQGWLKHGMSSETSLNLSLPKPVSRPSSSPTSPTASKGTSAVDLLGSSPAPTSSKEPPPLYAKFNQLGVLDVPETLIAIARRFEKLERWTVGHVRALEDRVGDIEKWLVDKEEIRVKAEEENKKNAVASVVNAPEVTKHDLQRVESEIGNVKEGLADVRTRLIDMNKTVLSQGTKPSTPVQNGSHTSSGSSSAIVLSSSGSRTKLPYPTGDYNSEEPAFTPPTSTPPRVRSPVTRPSYAANSSPAHIALPNTPSLHAVTSYTSLTSVKGALPVPPATNSKPDSASTSPVPRKRYTVALGGPLTSPLDQLAKDFEVASKFAEPQSYNEDEEDEDEDEDEVTTQKAPQTPIRHKRDDTIGGTPISLARLDSVSPPNLSKQASNHNTPSPSASRIRAQSSYGAPSGWNPGALGSTTPPLRPRRRSGGSNEQQRPDRGPPPGTYSSGFGSGSFVDPLVVRKKEREGQTAPRAPGPQRGKTSFNELLAFFDGEK